VIHRLSSGRGGGGDSAGPGAERRDESWLCFCDTRRVNVRAAGSQRSDHSRRWAA
jgi:hypothetical protein